MVKITVFQAKAPLRGKAETKKYKGTDCPQGLHLCYQLCGFVPDAEAAAEWCVHAETLLEVVAYTAFNRSHTREIWRNAHSVGSTASMADKFFAAW